MSTRSVRTYVAQQLDGLSVPTIAEGTVRAMAYPAVLDTWDTPIVWVLPLHVEETRVTGPRYGSGLGGIGKRERLHLLALIVQWVFNADTSDPGQFDDLIQVLDAAIYQIPAIEGLTDSVTGEVSTLMAVAEGDLHHGQVRINYPQPKRADTEGTWLYSAVFTVPAWEWLEG